MKKYLPTGNEQLSLPKLNEENIGVEDVTFLHMGCKPAPYAAVCRGGRAELSFEKHPLAEAWLLGARLHLLGRPH